MTELDFIIDLHKATERQGPGSVRDTLKALSFVDLPNNRTIKVADIGCGSGGQTMTLAQNLNAQITAIDLFPQFLDTLNERSKQKGLSEMIKTVEASMDNLPFQAASLDLIWAEGAIYNIGFQKGIQEWRNYLKPGAYLAISEITWLTNKRPAELEQFWSSQYDEMYEADVKLVQLESNGYTIAGHFFLEPSSWIDGYYIPLSKGFDDFLHRHQNNPEAVQLVKAYQKEIDLYMRYKDFYSYGFYVARKN